MTGSANDLVSLRQFARGHGTTLAAVQRAIETHRITAVVRASSGRILGVYAAQASAQWKANTDPAQAARRAKPAIHERPNVTENITDNAPAALVRALELAICPSIALMTRRGLAGKAALELWDEFIVCTGQALEEVLGREISLPTDGPFGELLHEAGRERLIRRAEEIRREIE